MAEFDEYAEGYSAGMENPLKRVIAKNAVDFLAPKIGIIKSIVSERESEKRIRTLLDYGCGSGEFLKLISEKIPKLQLTGTDISNSMMDEARKRHCAFTAPFQLESLESALTAGKKYDIITATCVFHHIPPADWQETVHRLANSLTDFGSLLIIEHNPLNPITRWVVSRTEIDRHAVLLSHQKTRRLMLNAGMKILASKSFMFTPPSFLLSAFTDKALGWSMLGGQYYVIAQNN